jgi:eukaryotic-like serine/threonine-protein kinase
MTKQGHGHVRRGEVLAGKYRVDRVLGEGGMGVVVAAHHLQLDQKVALKFLLPDALENSDSVARFRREAQAAVKIKSEHVARVTDVGELENGAPYIVMEYLEGSDLADWLKEHGPLPVEQAVDFVLQACEALAEAHVLGIVHRDLKPANLFCIEHPDGRPSIKILDFGISKITTEGAHDMTQTNSLFGSPQYMSPEQLRSSKGVDLRTDVWALGTILFELVSGRPAFLAGSITELVIVIANDPPPSLGVIRPGLPPALEAIVNRCLEKDRTRRFENVGELAVALEELGPKSGRVSVERVLGTLRKAGLGDTAAPKSPGGPQSDDAFAPTLFEATPPGSWGHTAGRISSGGWLALAIGVALLLIGVVGVGLLFHGRRGTASNAPSGSASTSQAAGAPELPTRDVSPAGEQVADSSSAQTAAAPIPAIPPPVSPSKPPSRPHAGGLRQVSSAPSVSPSATPPPSASAPAKPNCSPPYVIDSAGDHQYKPECL